MREIRGRNRGPEAGTLTGRFVSGYAWLNCNIINGMRKKLKIEEPPDDKPVVREETVKKIAAQLAEWASMSETEPKVDEQHAG